MNDLLRPLPAWRRRVCALRFLGGLIASCLLLSATGAGAQELDDDPIPPLRRAEAARKAAAALRWRAAMKAASPNQLRYDARFYDLDLDLDPVGSTLSATVAMEADVLDGPLAQVQLDLDGALLVTAVRSEGVATAFSQAAGSLWIDLDRPYLNGERFRVEVDYNGTPDASQGAFGFDSHNGSPMIWSLSEPFGARTWWPCKDTPSDKADSVAIALRVPESLIAVSNGVLGSSSSAAGTTRYEWFESHPISTYLVSVAAHPYVQTTATYTPTVGAPMGVQIYSFADQSGNAPSAAASTLQQLATYADRFGPYPFGDEKYALAQFLWGGGMEHQTATSFCCFSDFLLAHELAHQWYGDHITCDDFSEIWLNEGFATYAEALWAETNGGMAAYFDNIRANRYYGSGTIYVPPSDLGDFNRIFDGNLSYDKASWVLHMLRGMVNDSTFFDILRAYSADPQVSYGTATTDDFRRVAEAVSGLDLSAFFDQWIHVPYFPTYSFDWTTTANAGQWTVNLDIDQLQTHHVYQMPLTVRVTTAIGSQDFVVQNDLAKQSYSLDLSEEPLSVSLDPDEWVLRTIEEKIAAPTFHRGVLLVNGVRWSTYGSEITSAYTDSVFTGSYPFRFWDVFDAPGGGYVAELPVPEGHGAIDPDTLGSFSTVVWIGNNFGGDLVPWMQAAIRSYLELGGNVLLMSRMGEDFLPPVRAAELGLRFAENGYVSIQSATAVHPDLVPMTRIGTQSLVSVFETSFSEPNSVLLFTESQSFAVDRGLGVWRQRPGGGSLRPSGGHFAYLVGRPYRWDHGALRSNVQVILAQLFGEPSTPTSSGPLPSLSSTRLLAPAPNPFNPRVTIRYVLARRQDLRVELFDARGRRVRLLFAGNRAAGAAELTWDGRDDRGRPVASGVYGVRLLSEDGDFHRKITLVR